MLSLAALFTVIFKGYKMTHYETIHKETRDGFDIVFSTCHEDMKPDFFEDEQEEAQFWKDLERGDTAWFVARVQAFKNGIELGTDYLGGCWYASEMDFVNDSDYYGDMINSAIDQAKKNILALVEGLIK